MRDLTVNSGVHNMGLMGRHRVTVIYNFDNFYFLLLHESTARTLGIGKLVKITSHKYVKTGEDRKFPNSD